MKARVPVLSKSQNKKAKAEIKKNGGRAPRGET